MRSIKDALGQQTDRLASADGILANIVVALSRPTVVNTTFHLPGPLETSVSMPDADSQPFAVGDQGGQQPVAFAAVDNSALSNVASRPVVIAPFKIYRQIESVVDLWREYSLGVDGRPSIKVMYENEDETWKRGNDTERKFYDRRKVVLQLVEDLGEQRNIPNEEAAAHVEAYRLKQKPSSLNHLAKLLRKLSVQQRRQLQVTSTDMSYSRLT